MKFIPNEVSRKVAKAVLKSKKNSPHIFFALGVAGVITSTVLACKSTLNAGKEIEEFKGEVADIRERASNTNELMAYDSEGDYVKDLLHVYAKGAYRIGKLYILPAAVGGVSIVMLTGSHVTLSKRNAALSGALASAMKTLADYRLRVQERFGVDEELEVYRGVEMQQVEDGKKKKLEPVVDTSGWSEYMQIFDPSNANWENSIELNRWFLQCQENYWNTRLQTKGFVFLNEVLEALGFKKTKAGQLVGWVYEKGQGDHYIDFGLYEAHATPFFQGKTRELCIDFNVDGVILELIDAEDT